MFFYYIVGTLLVSLSSVFSVFSVESYSLVFCFSTGSVLTLCLMLSVAVVVLSSPRTSRNNIKVS
jgi:hypothetical protein